MKKFLVIFLLFSACSVVDETTFLLKSNGEYTLNSTGARFLKKVTGESVAEGDTISFSQDSRKLSIGELNADGYTIATLVELKKSYQGVFMICNDNTYVAMGLEDNMWISTTNTKSSPDDVLFEHLVPIATKND